MRPYLTVAEYSEKYGVPESTVKNWIRSKKLSARKDVRPMLISDDQGIPVKAENGYEWRIEKRSS